MILQLVRKQATSILVILVARYGVADARLVISLMLVLDRMFRRLAFLHDTDLPVCVSVAEPMGSKMLVFFKVALCDVVTLFFERYLFEPSDELRLMLKREAVHPFDGTSGKRIGRLRPAKTPLGYSTRRPMPVQAGALP